MTPKVMASTATTQSIYAHQVAHQISILMESFNGYHLILVAEPHILGHLRESFAPQMAAKLSIRELAKDLCRLSAHDLEKYLINKQLLPGGKSKSNR